MLESWVLTLCRLTARLFFQFFASISSWDLASTSAFCLWLSKYLLTACRGKYKENVKHRILTITLNTPNVLLFNLQKKHIHQLKYQNRKFWNFKTTNELIIVLNGSLIPPVFYNIPTPFLKHIEKRYYLNPFLNAQ